MNVCALNGWKMHCRPGSTRHVKPLTIVNPAKTIAVIGGGSAGFTAARTACKLGAKVLFFMDENRATRPLEQRPRHASALVMNFSSFAISAANFRIPSAVFSVAIAFSLTK